MLFELELRSFLVGSALSLVVGGGAYGFYVKTFGQASYDQAVGYKQLADCTMLLGSSDNEKVKQFLDTLPEKLKQLQKSDAIMTTINSTANEKYEASGMGVPLRMCATQLAEQIK
ncbi:hypothetical protein SBW85_19650 [Vibrio plantisponsor]|uniref:Uncharacterized protein n=1 Tax=Vibrio plantisponsor TaxID=664643 RepID=A0ABU4IMW8_9VIBR|nr:hypothetical protein [Vibrio plantisponsor]MDW6019923.1 hypothetical protein [Vibrio plantisponsor]NNM38748.1 hypothetical protein [Vibrio plantisponsor]